MTPPSRVLSKGGVGVALSPSRGPRLPPASSGSRGWTAVLGKTHQLENDPSVSRFKRGRGGCCVVTVSWSPFILVVIPNRHRSSSLSSSARHSSSLSPTHRSSSSLSPARRLSSSSLSLSPTRCSSSLLSLAHLSLSSSSSQD